MPIRTHRHALGEARATVAALYPAGRGVRPGGDLGPLPSDYWHVSNASYTSSPYAPQQSFVGSGGSSFSFGADAVVFVPFFVGRRGRTVTEMGARLTAAPALPAGLKLGIYACAAPALHDVYPLNLVASTTVVLAASTGRQVAPLAAPVVLENGLYWLAAGRTSTNVVSVRAINGTGAALTAERHPLQWSTTAPTLDNNRLLLSLPNASPLPTYAPLGMTLVTGANNPQLEIA